LWDLITEIFTWPGIKAVVAFITMAITWTFDTKMESVLVIALLILLDTITGFCKAWKRGKISSNGFFRFALKCMVYFALMATGALADKVLPIKFCMTGMVSFLAVTEAISILENLGSIGYAIPQGLLKKLHRFNQDDEIEEDKKEK
jgi:toxin secretion/phage lysis holin